MKTPLERPEVPSIDRPLRWPRAIAIFGAGERVFAERLRARLRERGVVTRTLRVELRHAEGFEREGGVVTSSPSHLLEALEGAATDELTIGIGVAFAAAVDCDLRVHLRGARGPLTLSAAERALARGAHLQLEEPRDATAEALADTLATKRFGSRL